MVTLRLGHSLLAVLFLVPAMGGFVACTVLAIALWSPLAAAGAALFAVAVLFLGRILVRRSRTRPDEVVVTGGLGGAAVSGPAFITFARHSLGLWSQPGVVMIADHGGIFLPMGFARHLFVEFVLTVFVPTVRFADVSFDIGGTSPEVMADAAERHGGFLLGPDWYVNDTMRWLTRGPDDGVVVLDRAPPERLGMFQPAPRKTDAEINHSLARTGVAFGAGSAALVSIGGVGAYVWDDLEILVGFGAFAMLPVVAFVIAAVIVKRQPRT